MHTFCLSLIFLFFASFAQADKKTEESVAIILKELSVLDEDHIIFRELVQRFANDEDFLPLLTQPPYVQAKTYIYQILLLEVKGALTQDRYIRQTAGIWKFVKNPKRFPDLDKEGHADFVKKLEDRVYEQFFKNNQIFADLNGSSAGNLLKPEFLDSKLRKMSPPERISFLLESIQKTPRSLLLQKLIKYHFATLLPTHSEPGRLLEIEEFIRLYPEKWTNPFFHNPFQEWWEKVVTKKYLSHESYQTILARRKTLPLAEQLILEMAESKDNFIYNQDLKFFLFDPLHQDEFGRNTLASFAEEEIQKGHVFDFSEKGISGKGGWLNQLLRKIIFERMAFIQETGEGQLGFWAFAQLLKDDPAAAQMHLQVFFQKEFLPQMFWQDQNGKKVIKIYNTSLSAEGEKAEKFLFNALRTSADDKTCEVFFKIASRPLDIQQNAIVLREHWNDLEPLLSVDDYQNARFTVLSALRYGPLKYQQTAKFREAVTNYLSESANNFLNDMVNNSDLRIFLSRIDYRRFYKNQIPEKLEKFFATILAEKNAKILTDKAFEKGMTGTFAMLYGAVVEAYVFMNPDMPVAAIQEFAIPALSFYGVAEELSSDKNSNRLLDVDDNALLNAKARFVGWYEFYSGLPNVSGSSFRETNTNLEMRASSKETFDPVSKTNRCKIILETGGANLN